MHSSPNSLSHNIGLEPQTPVQPNKREIISNRLRQQDQDKQKLLKRISNAFKTQQEHTEVILAHMNQTKHPIILAGDLNNTAFSYVYRKFQNNMNDAFIEKGSGLGTTFKFDHYPMRIDYIFGSKELEVLEFTSLKQTFSDHFPIAAIFAL